MVRHVSWSNTSKKRNLDDGSCQSVNSSQLDNSRTWFVVSKPPRLLIATSRDFSQTWDIQSLF